MGCGNSTSLTVTSAQVVKGAANHLSGNRVTFSTEVCDKVIPASSTCIQPLIYNFFDLCAEAERKELLRDLSLGHDDTRAATFCDDKQFHDEDVRIIAVAVSENSTCKTLVSYLRLFCDSTDPQLLADNENEKGKAKTSILVYLYCIQQHSEHSVLKEFREARIMQHCSTTATLSQSWQHDSMLLRGKEVQVLPGITLCNELLLCSDESADILTSPTVAELVSQAINAHGPQCVYLLIMAERVNSLQLHTTWQHLQLASAGSMVRSSHMRSAQDRCVSSVDVYGMCDTQSRGLPRSSNASSVSPSAHYHQDLLIRPSCSVSSKAAAGLSRRSKSLSDAAAQPSHRNAAIQSKRHGTKTAAGLQQISKQQGNRPYDDPRLSVVPLFSPPSPTSWSCTSSHIRCNGGITERDSSGSQQGGSSESDHEDPEGAAAAAAAASLLLRTGGSRSSAATSTWSTGTEGPGPRGRASGSGALGHMCSFLLESARVHVETAARQLPSDNRGESAVVSKLKVCTDSMQNHDVGVDRIVTVTSRSSSCEAPAPSAMRPLPWQQEVLLGGDVELIPLSQVLLKEGRTPNSSTAQAVITPEMSLSTPVTEDVLRQPEDVDSSVPAAAAVAAAPPGPPSTAVEPASMISCTPPRLPSIKGCSHHPTSQNPAGSMVLQNMTLLSPVLPPLSPSHTTSASMCSFKEPGSVTKPEDDSHHVSTLPHSPAAGKDITLTHSHAHHYPSPPLSDIDLSHTRQSLRMRGHLPVAPPAHPTHQDSTPSSSPSEQQMSTSVPKKQSSPFSLPPTSPMAGFMQMPSSLSSVGLPSSLTPQVPPSPMSGFKQAAPPPPGTQAAAGAPPSSPADAGALPPEASFKVVSKSPSPSAHCAGAGKSSVSHLSTGPSGAVQGSHLPSTPRHEEEEEVLIPETAKGPPSSKQPDSVTKTLISYSAADLEAYGLILQLGSQWELAKQAFLLAHRVHCIVSGEGHALALQCLEAAATCCEVLGQVQQAIQLRYRTWSSVAAKESSRSPSSRNQPAAAAALGSLVAIGRTRSAAADHEGAADALRFASGQMDSLLGAHHLESLACLRMLAGELRKCGCLCEAFDTYREVYCRALEAMGPPPSNCVQGIQDSSLHARYFPESLSALHSMGACLLDQGKMEQAEEVWEKALAPLLLLEDEDVRQLSATESDTGDCGGVVVLFMALLQSLAGLRFGCGQLEGAVKLYERLASVKVQVYGMEHPDAQDALQLLKVVSLSLNKGEVLE
ncbi:hypothetical protein CEUSTIGMA_g10257.t1 [Chlamydomonas eustigma]|uniref:Uncharacterized protein n=1 Tax=Chlamydomonas eustigma TaxID=1157962 RepID=A0A250XIC2_9CHLO|nr:hypothetical protein CEUSTIGMA_g10257.t1 [Chlamydomonas eustigma]|eukprot:GAX82831.1 hypothetical protein CEUSTIGMA_g10257.t1 [Chlamydomonas eustigma]